MWQSIISSVLQAVQLGVGAYSQYQAMNQQRKLQKAQSDAEMRAFNIERANKNASQTATIINTNKGLNRGLSSLKIPLKNSYQSPYADINDGVGLNVPL